MTTAATTAVRRRYRTAVLAVVAIIATSCHAARPPKTESRLFDVPARVPGNLSHNAAEPISITFEGGRTATVPPDESLYTPVDVAPVNKTAAAAGDYDDDYEFASTDEPGYDGNDTTTISPAAMNATVTSAATDATVTPPATKITVTPPVTDTTVAATTTVAPTTSATTTKPGILMQVASPPGYGTTTPTTTAIPITTTTPTTRTTSTTKTTTHLPPNSATAQQHPTASVCLLVLVAAVITSMS